MDRDLIAPGNPDFVRVDGAHDWLGEHDGVEHAGRHRLDDRGHRTGHAIEAPAHRFSQVLPHLVFKQRVDNHHGAAHHAREERE